MQNSSLQYTVFPNGVRLVHRRTQSPIVWCGVMVGTGSRDEQAEQEGMAHFIEHTLFKGTARRSARQIVGRIEDVGGELNAYTTKEETVFYATVLPAYTHRALEVLADMVAHPTFPEKELRHELEVIYDEIDSYKDSPAELIYDDFEASLFGQHPLSHSILGTRKTLHRFTPAMAHDFMRCHYGAENLVVFVDGAIDYERVCKLTERYFGDIPQGEGTRLRTAPVACENIEQKIHKRTHQTHYIVGGIAPRWQHTDQIAFQLLSNILGGGQISSLLNMALRERKGLVYTVESTYQPLSDTGYWSIYFACDKTDVAVCEQVLWHTIEQFCTHPIPATTLEKYKRQLLGQLAITASIQENNALQTAKYVLHNQRLPQDGEVEEAIRRVEADSLIRLAKSHLNPQKAIKLLYF